MRPHILMAVLLASVSAHAAAPAYRVIELLPIQDHPGGDVSPVDINASGDAAGVSISSDDRDARAVIWRAADDGVATALTTHRSWVRVTLGSVVGGEFIFPARNQAALWVNGSATLLPDPFPPAGEGEPYTQVTAVIDATTAAGRVEYPRTPGKPVLWSGGVATFLPTLGPSNAQPTDANAAGTICGVARTPASQFRGVIWENGAITRVLLPLAGHPNSFAEGINATGEVTGTSHGVAVRWPAGSVNPIALPLLPDGSFSGASDLNDAGWVVGFVTDSRNRPRATLWTDAQTVINLNAAIPPGSGWDLQQALAISNDGVIVGEGRFNGRSTGFMLQPVRQTPIVVIPGIMGTTLSDALSNDVIWYDLFKAIASGDDAYLNVLDLNAPNPAAVDVGPLLGPIYDPLLQFLEGQGYAANGGLFAFSYDWRHHNSSHVQPLQDYIENVVLPVSGSDRVILVAHSMGGLIARAFALQHPNLVEKVIYVGTPHSGSAEMFAALAFDDEIARNFSGVLLIDRVTLARVAATFPSAFQLLPRAAFVFSGDEQRLLTLAETYTSSFLRSVQWVAEADQFHSSIAASPQVPQFQVVGSGLPTLGSFSWSHGRTGERKWIPFVDDGDGTVTRSSAAAAPGGPQPFFIDAVPHDALPEDLCVQQLIVAIAKDDTPPSCASSQPFPLPPGAAWSTGSPVRVTIRDGADRINEDVPGSRFWTLEENEGGFLAAGADHRFEIVAHDTGVFSLTFRDGQEITHEFARVPVAPGARATLTLHADGSTSAMEVDIDGDGTPDASFGAGDTAPETALVLLGGVLKTLPIGDGLRRSLTAKVDAATRAVARGDANTAANVLHALLAEIDAQTDKGLVETAARGLRVIIESVIEGL